MHDETRGLVDDDERVVFVDDVERHRLRRERELLRQQVGHEFDGGAKRHRLANFRRRAVDAHALRLDPALQPVAREFGENLGEHLVEAFARQFVRHLHEARRFAGARPCGLLRERGRGGGRGQRRERVGAEIVVEGVACQGVVGVGA